MKISKAALRNMKMFGARYLFYDILYHIFRRINNLVKDKSIGKKALVKHKVNDYYMYINKNGAGIHRDLYLKSTREESSVKIVKEILKKGDVVLEAGANVGYYAILESRIIGDSGVVYAVEPVKENFELLKKNVKLNNLKNVKTYNFGFGEKDGNININVSPEGNLNTPADIGCSVNKERVKCLTLDSFFRKKKKPDFMRMDIEGYEDVVFKGGDKTLDSLKVIFVELHFPLLGKERMEKLLKKLKKKGFEIYKGVIEWERLEKEDNLLGKFVNYLYKKRSKPVVYDNLTIDNLINMKEFMEGHLSLEVFFRKVNEKTN